VGKDRPEHDVLTRTQGRSTDGGIAESRRRKTPLVLPRKLSGERRKGPVFRSTSGTRSSPVKGKTPLDLPCEGRDAGARVSPNLWNHVLSLAGRDREGLPSQGAAGHPLERDREDLATRRACLCRVRGPPSIPPGKGTAAWFAPRLDASVPPFIRTKPRQQKASHTRSLAPPTRAISPDTQWETIQPLIPPQRSGGDGRLLGLRDVIQAMFSGTKNGGTGCTLPGDARPPSAPHRERLGRGREPRSCSFSGLLGNANTGHLPD